MSIEQYKDKNRAELWEIVKTQAQDSIEQNKRIAELESQVKRIKKAVKVAFPSLVACDYYFNVHMDHYNGIARAISGEQGDE